MVLGENPQVLCNRLAPCSGHFQKRSNIVEEVRWWLLIFFTAVRGYRLCGKGVGVVPFFAVAAAFPPDAAGQHVAGFFGRRTDGESWLFTSGTAKGILYLFGSQGC